ncbi:MAG: hypothetical protein ACTHM9_11130 [Gemmatimonadales bacterium]
MTHRLRAWLLLALFLSAGTSLPSADALLNHRHPEPFRVHFDPAGGCAGHADYCTLGRTPPGSRAAAPAAFVARVAVGDEALHPLSPAARRPDARISLLPPSRAPPAPRI